MTKSINPGMTQSDSAHWNHLMSLVPVREQAWMQHAACVKTHPDAAAHREFADQWFASEVNPGRPRRDAKESPATREAKRICGGCSVRAECLMFSLVNKEGYGVWGGVGIEKRSEIRKRNPERYERPDDGRCKRGHGAEHRVPDGRGSTRCRKCEVIAEAKYRVGAA